VFGCRLAVRLLQAAGPEAFRQAQLELLGRHVIGMDLQLDFADQGVAQGDGDDGAPLGARRVADVCR